MTTITLIESSEPAPDDPCLHWAGPVTSADVESLRGELFDQLEALDGAILWLDVRAVTDLDRAGVALLIGAHERAAALGRQLVLIDAAGAVTETLQHLHLIEELDLVQVAPAGA
jgi:anti-anti-sigma regulatory factor